MTRIYFVRHRQSTKALSTVFNYFYPRFSFDDFMRIIDFMPFIIRFDFEGHELKGHQLELVIRKQYK